MYGQLALILLTWYGASNIVLCTTSKNCHRGATLSQARSKSSQFFCITQGGCPFSSHCSGCYLIHWWQFLPIFILGPWRKTTSFCTMRIWRDLCAWSISPLSTIKISGVYFGVLRWPPKSIVGCVLPCGWLKRGVPVGQICLQLDSALHRDYLGQISELIEAMHEKTWTFQPAPLSFSYDIRRTWRLLTTDENSRVCFSSYLRYTKWIYFFNRGSECRALCTR